MSRRNQPKPTQFLQHITQLENLDTLLPDEKWRQLSSMLREHYDRSAKGELPTRWNTESAILCNIDIFESILH